MKSVNLAAAFVLLAAPAFALADTTLYTQFPSIGGAYYSGSGTSDKAADDFTLTSTGTINHVSFLGTYFGVAGTPASDTFAINFFSDSGNFPGGLLSTSTVTPTRVDTGYAVGGKEIFTFKASVNAFTATGGATYFLQIVSSTTQNFAWLAGSGGNGTHIDDGTASASGVNSDSSDLAFTLKNVTPVATTPEPSSLTLLGTGVLTLAGVGRRRLRKS